MPDEAKVPGSWSWLGRLLPAEVRERVFEPALNDAYRRTIVDGDGPGFASAAIGTYLACLPIAIPRLFVSRGRLTPLGRLCLGCLIALGLFRIALEVLYTVYR